jgi:hypothetical protein
LWSRRVNPRDNEILNLTEEFSARVKGLGWYIPSESHFSLKPYLVKQENSDLEAYRKLPAKRFPWRAYLVLLKESGLSSVDITHPVPIKKYAHISEGKYRLAQFFGQDPVSKYEVIYTLVRGITPAWFLDHTSKAGWPPYLERLTKEEEKWGEEILSFFIEGKVDDDLFFSYKYGALSLGNCLLAEGIASTYPEFAEEVYAVHSTATGGESIKHSLFIYEEFRDAWNLQAWAQPRKKPVQPKQSTEEETPPQQMEELTAYIRYQIDGFIAQRDLWVSAREGADLDTGQIPHAPIDEICLDGEGLELDDDFSFGMFD